MLALIERQECPLIERTLLTQNMVAELSDDYWLTIENNRHAARPLRFTGSPEELLFPSA